MALKHESVISNWNTLVINGAGHGEQIIEQIDIKLGEAKMPGIYAEEREVGSGIFSEKRKFLVVGHRGLKDYKLYIGARDFGIHLDVSWYLTIQPSGLKRMLSKYMTGNPQALSMQVDFFSQQDLSACMGYIHHCVTETTRELLKQLEQDPTGLNTKSKGFLELW